MAWQIDLACAVAHWEDESRIYKESAKKSDSEAAEIGNVLDKYKRQLRERG